MTNQTPESVIAEIRHRRAYSVYGDGTAYLDIGRLLEALELVRAERDAALAAIERVTAERDSAMARIAKAWELHEPFTWSFGYGPVQSCKWCADHGVSQEVASWPCPTVAALDGAPEPEGRWEYRGRLQSCGYVAEGYISAEYAMNGLRVELEDHPYLAMDDTAIVERARVREWLPVEGESKP